MYSANYTARSIYWVTSTTKISLYFSEIKFQVSSMAITCTQLRQLWQIQPWHSSLPAPLVRLLLGCHLEHFGGLHRNHPCLAEDYERLVLAHQQWIDVWCACNLWASVWLLLSESLLTPTAHLHLSRLLQLLGSAQCPHLCLCLLLFLHHAGSWRPECKITWSSIS